MLCLFSVCLYNVLLLVLSLAVALWRKFEVSRGLGIRLRSDENTKMYPFPESVKWSFSFLEAEYINVLLFHELRDFHEFWNFTNVMSFVNFMNLMRLHEFHDT